MTNQPPFPYPIRMNKRLFWRRSEIETYKQAVFAVALGVVPPAYVVPAIEKFVTAETLAAEFGFTRRTLGRRIAELPIINVSNREAGAA